MNEFNSTGVRISKRDYFKLPPEMRQISNGPMVLSRIAGRQTFVRAIIID